MCSGDLVNQNVLGFCGKQLSVGFSVSQYSLCQEKYGSSFRNIEVELHVMQQISLLGIYPEKRKTLI